jgi:sulfide:quinone oxidoreductase
VIAGAPYTCPPAPYECALLLDEWLRERGLRERTELAISTFQPMLLPNAGREGSAWLGERLAARGIEAHAGRKVERVEERRVVHADGELEVDLVFGVPPLRAPEVVAQAGLASEGGWIAVDPGSLATGHPRVFAVGDVTQIKLANDLPLPKAGIIAEREGAQVAAAIAAEIRGEGAPAPLMGAATASSRWGGRRRRWSKESSSPSPSPWCGCANRRRTAPRRSAASRASG